MNITFLNPWLLLGMSATAIPILLHLFQRSRYQRIAWGATLFLRNCVQSSARHIKLQNALLMLNRMLLIFCFCLAISRPVLQPRVAPADPQQHPEAAGKSPMGTAHVFILDASASMSLHQHEETLFAAAQKAILKIIDQMPAQDTCNVVLAGRRAHSLFSQNEKNNAVIRKQIMNIRAGFETANIPLAIIRALQLLQDSRLPRRRIYIIGDTQVTNWRLEDRRLWRKIGAMLKKTRIPPALYFLPLPLPAKAEKNIQIVSITSPEPLQDTFRESHFLIKIINYGSDPQVSRLDFFVDGKLKTERRVTLKPGENVFLFRNLFSSAGVHLLHAQVEDTAFIPDNEFVYACRINDVLPVLVSVDDPEDNTVTRASSIFVREALSTGISRHAQLFRVSTISHARLDTMDPAELRRYRAILILDPPSFSHHLRLRLRNYVRVGGGVMILAGPKLNATTFRNQELSEQEPFLPCSFRRQVLIRQRGLQLAASPQAMTNTPFSFWPENLPSPEQLRIYRMWQLLPRPNARVLANYGDLPLFVHQPFGNGHLVVCAVPDTGLWSNLPFTEAFLPLMQHLSMMLARRNYPPVNLTVGDPIFLSISSEVLAGSASSGIPQLEIITPEHKTQPLHLSFSDHYWLAQFTETFTPGVYRVIHKNRLVIQYGVHLDPAEGDLSSLTARQLRELSKKGIKIVPHISDLIRLLQRESVPLEIWRYFLILTIILSMTELFMAWRFSL